MLNLLDYVENMLFSPSPSFYSPLSDQTSSNSPPLSLPTRTQRLHSQKIRYPKPPSGKASVLARHAVGQNLEWHVVARGTLFPLQHAAPAWADVGLDVGGFLVHTHREARPRQPTPPPKAVPGTCYLVRLGWAAAGDLACV